ncbi:probable E3 ubiquitin-protein ligase MARCHF10 isoform X2 [Impatiens glandulifera]|uniref:probable E3 ubiquitin-protein ligase MARCHF10 isoform X2 n=1 Tax=Impatiens glandulifera TaxID=253017 RepID=UPI001FB09474|nr:probable E3 ubiquitin-protein ligase MARCHF10 isoform X2 [Impatiens glandulifera]
MQTPSDNTACNSSSDASLPQARSHTNLTQQSESVISISNARRPGLPSLQVPPRPYGFTGSHSGNHLLHSHSFKKKKKVSVAVNERSPLLNPDITNQQSPILANLKSLWTRGGTSLPVTPASNLSNSIHVPGSARTIKEHIKSIGNSEGRSFVIVRSVSFAARDIVQTDVDDVEELEDEHIPEEEAVCRICFGNCDDGNMLKIECSCKGDLRLIHELCAVKWFKMKGNNNCDICGQEVRNLPVTLLRMESSTQINTWHEFNQQMHDSSAWQDFILIVLISIFAYFFILQQILVESLKTEAIGFAAPFALILGILSSAFAALLANRGFIFVYAALQFLLIGLLVYFLYTVLGLSAFYALTLSSALGFGLAASIQVLCIQYRHGSRVTQNSSGHV